MYILEWMDDGSSKAGISTRPKLPRYARHRRCDDTFSTKPKNAGAAKTTPFIIWVWLPHLDPPFLSWPAPATLV
jgi:hypothetical protein